MFVEATLGSQLTSSAEREPDLATIVLNELDCSVPALLCSAPGYDASGRVDDLATQNNQLLSSVAIGSAEGFRQATDAINSAVRLGRYDIYINHFYSINIKYILIYIIFTILDGCC